MPIPAKEVLQVTHAPAKRSLLQKIYEQFYKSANIKLVTVADSLPYPYQSDVPFYVVHVQIESRSEPDVWYDIVVQVLGTKLEPSTDVRVYNNCPAFVYFLAYVFHKRDALIFQHLYPIQVFTIPPKERNPKHLIEPDKYTYTAFRYIKSRRITKESVERLNKQKWTYIRSPKEIERIRALKVLRTR